MNGKYGSTAEGRRIWLMCRQAGLGEHAGDAVAMHVQLGRDGADTPAFGVVITQDLRFNFGAEGHVFSGRVGDGESDAQEVLAHPVRQGTMATTAVPWQPGATGNVGSEGSGTGGVLGGEP
jgi:hypothetical protein